MVYFWLFFPFRFFKATGLFWSWFYRFTCGCVRLIWQPNQTNKVKLSLLFIMIWCLPQIGLHWRYVIHLDQLRKTMVVLFQCHLFIFKGVKFKVFDLRMPVCFFDGCRFYSRSCQLFNRSTAINLRLIINLDFEIVGLVFGIVREGRKKRRRPMVVNDVEHGADLFG